MGRPTVPSDVTLSDPERSKSKPFTFGSVIAHKRGELDFTLLLVTNRKSIYGESNGTITFDLERSKSRSLRFSAVGNLCIIGIKILIWMSNKRKFAGGRIFRCTSSHSYFNFNM